MPVFKRAGAWVVRIQVGGRRAEKSLGPGSTRQDALLLESRLRRDAIAGKLGVAPERTLNEAVLRWLETDARALKSYQSLLGKARLIYPHTEGVRLRDAVEAAEAIKRAGLEAGLAPATINRRLAILRRICNRARDWGWLDEDLGSRIKLLSGERARHIYLTPAQVQALIDACKHPRVADAIRLAAATGMRESELLRASEVRDGCVVLGETKSGRPRLVPLPPGLKVTLPLGIGYSTLRTYWERARDDAGLPGVRFHDLRHTAASWWVQAGVSLGVVRDLLGHANLAVTSRYAHLSTDDLKAAMEKVARKGVG